jgi:hypothetical protein
LIELDTSQAPRGVLAAQSLIDAVAKQGDLAERHYLEIKSNLNLTTKRDKEKIAKFILGASNRMPDVASTAFEGYGVMIIGVAQGAITGIPPVETMEISKVIQKYVGAAGPRWDIVWVPIDGSSNQVLVVLVDPPKLGQGPFPCRATGESLTDGRIYIRADGETREANSEEVDLLIQRSLPGSQVAVDFAFELVGEIAFVTLDDTTTVDQYVAIVRDRLVAALPRKEWRPPTAAASMNEVIARMSGYTSALDLTSAAFETLIEPESRTEEEYLDSIDLWEAHFRRAWGVARTKIAASQLGPAIVRITNRTTTFFHDVQVRLHLEGDVFAFDYRDRERVDDFSDLELPHPPRKWGPTQRSLGLPYYANLGHTYTPSANQYIPPSITYKNEGSVLLNLEVGELRPRGTYESEDEEIVLIVADRSLASIHGTWELTARDHNNVYTGQIVVAVAGDRDFTAVARHILELEGDDADEEADE